ncbi:hypothetical protein MSG28_014059, partial [Choristoneura fumiferana]
MLSDFEDDIGEDLPSISLSQSTGEKVRQLQPAARIKPLDFLPGNVGSGITRSVLIAFQSVTEMPPAAEVASERARRAAAEQALRELREPPLRPPPPRPRPGPRRRRRRQGRRRRRELVKAWLELRVDPEGGGGGAGAARARGCCGSCARGWGRRPGRGRGRGRAGGALLDAWLRACQRGPDVAAAVTEQMLSGIILGLESAGDAKGTVAAAAWLLAVACTGGGAGGAGGGRGRRRGRAGAGRATRAARAARRARDLRP